jgi:hypothetical protein
MLHSVCPKHCWDDCLVREAYVRSHNALDIFSLEGQVPEIIVKGELMDISPMDEYAWYEWVKFCNNSVNFPDSKIQLGRYMGAVIDIGPGISRNVLNEKGKAMYRISVRYLTPN